MGVVTGGGKKATIGSKFKHAAVVATFTSLGGPFDDLLFISESIVIESEAADALAHKVRGRVEEKEVIVFFEAWIEGDSKESVLLLPENFDFSKSSPVSGDRMDPAHFSLQFDEINRAIRPKIHAHGAGEVFRDGLDFESERFNGAREVSEGKEEKCFEVKGHPDCERFLEIVGMLSGSRRPYGSRLSGYGSSVEVRKGTQAAVSFFY